MGKGSEERNSSLTSELLLLAKSFTSSVLIVLLFACLWKGQKQFTKMFGSIYSFDETQKFTGRLQAGKHL